MLESTLSNYFQIFKFKEIAKLCELPNAFMIGAGAGPAHIVGINSEVREPILTLAAQSVKIFDNKTLYNILF